MMSPVGQVFRTDSGRRMRVDGPFLIKSYDPALDKIVEVQAVGGEGALYWATGLGSGEKLVLKVFHPSSTNKDTARRIRFIFSQKLSAACPSLWSPVDVLTKTDIMGHFTDVVPGVPLEEHLTNPEFNLMEGLQLAIALAHAIGVLHQRRIAYGDLHPYNLFVNRSGSVLQLYVIDFDNFNAPGVPTPSMIGQNLYIAPELREALAKKQPAFPNIRADLYSLGVLMHEIIFLCHVATGSDKNSKDFNKAMCRGWRFDPLRNDRPAGDLGGYPVGILNPDLERLFRLALSPDPSERPTAEQWKLELCKDLSLVDYCKKCGCPYIIDISKVKCPAPKCQHPFPPLTMVVRGTGERFTLSHGAMVIGRKELGGSMKVSFRHAIFRRIGPETWMESIGSNGTYRWNGSGWTRLPDKKPILVESGDRLRLGDVEVELITAT